MFSRHDLVWLSAEGWDAAVLQAQPADRDAIAMWWREDWPGIVRRRDCGADEDVVSLGIALPPDPVDGRKRRIAMQARRAHVARHTPPLPLADAIRAAPAAWRDSLAALDASAASCGLRAYGSLAMQAITGQAYLSGTSDIDLLFRPSTASQLNSGIELLTAHAQHLPLDGEVVFPSEDAVAWKEWHLARSTAARVLVKTISAVRLADPTALLATLEGE